MSVVMTQTFETLSFVLNTWLVFMAVSGLFLVTIVVLPHREDAHKLVDRAYDSGNALLNWLGSTAHDIVEELKGIAVLAALPFIWMAEAMWDILKFTIKGAAISAGILAVVLATSLILTGAAISFWIAFPFIIGYVAVQKTWNMVSKASNFIVTKVEEAKAKAEAKAEKAEQERLEAVKAEAEALGFVSSEDVAEMIKAAIAKHEAEKHVAEAEAVVEHAVQVVLKSIEDFDLADKAGRKAARTYLRDNGVEIAGNANRHEISKKFELLN